MVDGPDVSQALIDFPSPVDLIEVGVGRMWRAALGSTKRSRSQTLLELLAWRMTL